MRIEKLVVRILNWVGVLAVVLALFAFLGVALYAGLIIFVVLLMYGMFLTVGNEIRSWWRKKNPKVEVEWYESCSADMNTKKNKAIDMGEIIIIDEEKKK